MAPQALLFKTMKLFVAIYTATATGVDNYLGNTELGKRGEQPHFHSKMSCTLLADMHLD